MSFGKITLDSTDRGLMVEGGRHWKQREKIGNYYELEVRAYEILK